MASPPLTAQGPAPAISPPFPPPFSVHQARSSSNIPQLMTQTPAIPPLFHAVSSVPGALFSLSSAMPLPVPPNALALEPPPVANSIRSQILSGTDVDFLFFIVTNFTSVRRSPNRLRRIFRHLKKFSQQSITHFVFYRIHYRLQSLHGSHMHHFPSQEMRARRLSRNNRWACTILWRLPFLHISQVIFSQMRNPGGPMEPMSLLGSTR